MFKPSARRPGMSKPRPRRGQERQPLVNTAKLSIDGREQTIACTLRDISNGGLRISVVSPERLPPEIMVICRGLDLTARVAITWRGPSEIGVRFIRKSDMSHEGHFAQTQAHFYDSWLAQIQAQEQAQRAAYEQQQREIAAAAQWKVDRWTILGLTPNSPLTAEMLKLAYHQQARANHPDKGGDHDHFQRINAAYAELMRELQAAVAEPQSGPAVA